MQCIFTIINGAVKQGFDVPSNRGNRCFQLMRNIGNKVSPYIFQTAQMGYIIKYQKYPHASAPTVKKLDPVSPQGELLLSIQ